MSKRIAYARTLFERLHQEEDGVAYTEYLIVFTLLSFGAALSLLACAVYVKGYRDFLVWWLAHPII